MTDSNGGDSRSGSDKVQLVQLVQQTMVRHSMIAPGQSLLVAVSGGGDSTAMLHILVGLSAEMSLRLGVAHLNHGMRGEEARADAAFVESLAGRYGLPHYEETVDARIQARRWGMSIEEACRRLRYRFLLSIAERHGYDRIAVGHHRDDNAETVLMGLLRGSGAAGLRGMAAVRDDGIVRPMIELSRRRIREYTDDHNLAFVTDSTNSDTRRLRNRIRHQLMPLLASGFNPNIVSTLNRIGAVLGPEDQWLNELCHRILEDTLKWRSPGVIALSVDRFKRLPMAPRRRVCRLALEEVKGNLRRIGLRHVTDILQMAESETGDARLDLPHGIRVRRCGDDLEFFNLERMETDADLFSRPSETAPYSYTMPSPGSLVVAETGESIRIIEIAKDTVPDFAAMTPEVVYLDADCVKFPVKIRNARPGDRFSPLGAGGSQKLKKFFCDHKIPHRRRSSCPLLLSADRIFWVAGMRIDNAAKLTAKTTRVLKAELILA